MCFEFDHCVFFYAFSGVVFHHIFHHMLFYLSHKINRCSNTSFDLNQSIFITQLNYQTKLYFENALFWQNDFKCCYSFQLKKKFAWFFYVKTKSTRLHINERAAISWIRIILVHEYVLFQFIIWNPFVVVFRLFCLPFG